MSKRNLAKDVKEAKLSPKLVNNLYTIANSYIFDLNNQTKVRIPKNSYQYGKLYIGDFVAFADLNNMQKRLVDFRVKQKKEPAFVNVLPPVATKTISNNYSTKGNYQKLFESVFGTVTTVKQVTDKIRSTGYTYYLNAYEIAKKTNSMGSVTNCMDRFKRKVPQNCCDISATLAITLFEMGYDVEILQTRCTKETHLLFRIKGKELGNTWQYVDPAPMASKTAPRCDFGKVCWCSKNGIPIEIVARNPKWFINMYYNDFKKVSWIK